MARFAQSRAFLLLLGTLLIRAQAKFLATNDAETTLLNQVQVRVAKGDVDAELEAAVSEALGGGHGASKEELRAVEAYMHACMRVI